MIVRPYLMNSSLRVQAQSMNSQQLSKEEILDMIPDDKVRAAMSQWPIHKLRAYVGQECVDQSLSTLRDMRAGNPASEADAMQGVKDFTIGQGLLKDDPEEKRKYMEQLGIDFDQFGHLPLAAIERLVEQGFAD